ncbi:MAG: NAD-dependent protein deacylase [Myxococcales bacterium]|nr:NAD-dependent protein deacylase [Myxococcales bacterium]
MKVDPDLLDEVADAMRSAQRMLFVTGAGISADSGLPTYRGVGGLYDDADTPEGMPIEDVLSGTTLQSDPALCWRHIAQIEAACRGAHPNAAHRIIAELAEQREVVILTQNVDGLHVAAGSSDVIEIHGSIHALRCTACPRRWRVPDYAELQIPPSCERCGALVRPEVVLFGEMLDPGNIHALTTALERPFDLVWSIGTTSAFPYIAAPVMMQARAGRPVVEINPGESDVSGLVTWKLRGGAADVMAALHSRLGTR